MVVFLSAVFKSKGQKEMIKPMTPEERERSKEREKMNNSNDPCDDWKGVLPTKEQKDV
jgi:hypothetical protein